MGFPVMGIWYEGWDRTDVNAVHRSNDGELVVLVDDFGSVNLLNAPCLIKYAPHKLLQVGLIEAVGAGAEVTVENQDDDCV